MSIKRSRYFATIVYPESAPASFVDIIKDLHVSFAISPIHDKDVFKDSGELKKPHYHVVLAFDSLKSVPQVSELIANFSGVGCEIINSLPSYLRYLTHMDDKDKFQYDLNDVIYSGIDYPNIILESLDRYALVSEVLSYCVSNNITNFSLLLLSLRQHDMRLFRCVVDNSFTVREFIKSYREVSFHFDKDS